jgi:hypothetical protein
MDPAKVEPLKFIALDPDDLEVVSTHLQDAEVKVADVHWRPQEKRLVLAVDRFDWQAWNASNPAAPPPVALRFDRVMSCKCKQVAPNARIPSSTSGGRVRDAGCAGGDR